ncbi:MAG: ATP-binding protein [Solobacterium sp.]|nr:ATP-binding protein [Solobacterium sp.]
MALFGLPMGVRKITAVFRSVYLNHLLAASATSYGVAAYNVQVQLGYLTNNLFMAIAFAMSMLLGFYYSEENKRGLHYTVSIALIMEIVLGLAITFLLRDWRVIPWISWFYLGSNPASREIANVAIYYFAIGLLGQALSFLFAVYLQTIGRTFLSNIIYILSDVVFIYFIVQDRLGRLHATVSDGIRCGVIFSGVSNAQLCMLGVIPFVILLVNFRRKRRPDTLGDMLLMLPKGYGHHKDRELTGSPKTLKQVNEFSEKAYDFCLGHGAGKREAYFISLAAEEMASNILKHGFKDSGYHTMELRVIHKRNSFLLRIRDNSHIFDPIKKMASVSRINDPSRYIGLKMIMKKATEVVYTSTLNLNNLVIRIDLPEDKKDKELEVN